MLPEHSPRPEQRQVRRPRERQVECGLAVRRRKDLVAVPLEPEADEGEYVRVVVGDEHERPKARHRATSVRSRTSASRWSGSVTRKVAPEPCWLATVIRPECASTIAFVMASPRPVP